MESIKGLAYTPSIGTLYSFIGPWCDFIFSFLLCFVLSCALASSACVVYFGGSCWYGVVLSEPFLYVYAFLLHWRIWECIYQPVGYDRYRIVITYRWKEGAAQLVGKPICHLAIPGYATLLTLWALLHPMWASSSHLRGLSWALAP